MHTKFFRNAIPWSLSAALILAASASADSSAGEVILDETFNDGQRLVQNLPATSAWYGSQAASLTQPADGIITSITGQTLLTYFTDEGTVSLGVGDELTVSFDFQLGNPSPAATHSGIRVGLMNSSTGGGRIGDDGFGSGNASFAGYTGYGGWIHPRGADTRVRERTNMELSGLLNTNTNWTNRTTNTADVTNILADTAYTGAFYISRTAEGVIATFSVAGANFGPVFVSYNDAGSSLFEFDTFGVWTNSNSGDSFSLTRVEITLIPAGPVDGTFAAWQMEVFTPAQLADSSVSGPAAGPAGDGISNFMKYALGLDPFLPSREALPRGELVENELTLVYTAPIDRLDADYIVEFSEDFLTWKDSREVPMETSQELDVETGVMTVTARVTGYPGVHGRGFLRLRVAEFHLESPYQFGAYQHKVQLHTHTTDSDGDHDGQWVMQAYEALGYVAVAKTDHDYTKGTPNLDDPGGHNIIHIPGLEYSADVEERSYAHLLGVNISSIHHLNGIANRPAQIAQAESEGGLTYLCHPYGENIHRRGWTEANVRHWVSGFTGIEIHNGSAYHQPGGHDYPYKVDLALTIGKPVNVIAVDDFHRNPAQTMDRGYVVINSDTPAASLTLEEVVEALRTGNCFAAGRTNTGHPVPPRFTDISVSGSTISVKTDKPVDIQFITDRHNYYKGEPWCSQLDLGVTEAHYTARAADKWIRIKAIFTQGGNRSYAWSNPIYVRSGSGEDR